MVSDDKDTATWQRRSLALHWASGLRAQTETEANHTRYAHAGPGALAGLPLAPARPQRGQQAPAPGTSGLVSVGDAILCVETLTRTSRQVG